jgi:hypothetical protein
MKSRDADVNIMTAGVIQDLNWITMYENHLLLEQLLR